MGYRNRGGGFLVGFGKYSIRLRSQEPCRGPDPDPLALFAVPGHTGGGGAQKDPASESNSNSDTWYPRPPRTNLSSGSSNPSSECTVLYKFEHLREDTQAN